MRKDPYTGELFEPKRNNQIYANRKNQVDHNNENARKKRSKTNLLDKRLKENRNIISTLLEKEDSLIIPKEFLKGRGFDLSLFNRIVKVDSNKACGIYEYYFQPLDKTNIKIGKI